ncbi:MAG: nucleotidyltransferase domain-containing protein [Alphaproteobacteria bacterium]|nr:nucleotidyltransferase domain-containing protein [Alphaproteobacteria bacterium]MCW5738754.1 nucleotidyltransferase domain-containing protein [Alphaproteobacteria bacterium]
MTDELALVREYKRRVEAKLPGRVAKVVLFGSRARGDASADSDWDIAVFLGSRPTVGERDVISDIAFDLMMETGAQIQALALSAASEAGDFRFYRNLRRDGVAA